MTFHARPSGLKISPMQTVILNALFAARHRQVSTAELVEHVYGASGGPLSASQVIQDAVSGLRKALDGTGWKIPKAKPGPGQRGGYRLEQVE
jgi:DNA-binding winged helix-turn-helix (wHTH) protein